MARTVTLADMRSSIIRKGSWENSDDITSVVVDEEINEAAAELWDIIVEKWEDYYTTEATLATVVGNDAVALPSTFYKFRKLEVLISGTLGAADERTNRLYPHDLEAAHRIRTLSGRRYRYRIQGGNIRLVPRPAAVETLRLYFIPWSPVLAADGDTFDGFNGYESLIKQMALARLYRRQDLPVDETNAEIDRLMKRVRSAANARDASEPFYLDPNGPPVEYEDEEPWP